MARPEVFNSHLETSPKFFLAIHLSSLGRREETSGAFEESVELPPSLSWVAAHIMKFSVTDHLSSIDRIARDLFGIADIPPTLPIPPLTVTSTTTPVLPVPSLTASIIDK